MPIISVIIPTYNSANYLPKAIDSVINQTYQDLDVIIVDDGSTDNTGEIVKGYLDKYSNKIRYFYQENEGPGAARNKGMLDAQGEFIAFLDADDLLLENSILKRVQFLVRYPEVSLVFTDYCIRDKENINNASNLKRNSFVKKYKKDIKYFKNKEEYVFNRSFINTYMVSRYPIWTGTVMIRKKAIEEIGLFRTDVRISEDLDYWARFAEKKTIGYIDMPLSIYNYYVSTSITKNEEKKYLDIITQLFSIYDNSSKKGLIRHKISLAYSGLGYYYFSNYKLDKAKKYFLLSIKYAHFQVYPFAYLICSLLPVSLLMLLKKIKKRISKEQ